MSRQWVPATSVLLLLGGCAAGPDYERPELDIPEAYVQPVAHAQIAPRIGAAQSNKARRKPGLVLGGCLTMTYFRAG